MTTQVVTWLPHGGRSKRGLLPVTRKFHRFSRYRYKFIGAGRRKIFEYLTLPGKAQSTCRRCQCHLGEGENKSNQMKFSRPLQRIIDTVNAASHKLRTKLLTQALNLVVVVLPEKTPR